VGCWETGARRASVSDQIIMALCDGAKRAEEGMRLEREATMLLCYTTSSAVVKLGPALNTPLS